jgi:hypothetical protein
MVWRRVLPLPDHLLLTLFYTRFKNRPDRLYWLMGLTILIGGWVYIGLVFNADPLGIVSIDAEPAQHLRGRRVRLEPGRVPHRARPGDGHQDARLCRRRADPRRDALVHHAVGRCCPTRAGR